MADGWIELFDVETDEAELLFVFDRIEPVDYGCGVFPLVEVAFFRHCAVDAVEDVEESPLLSQSRHDLVFEGNLRLQINQKSTSHRRIKRFRGRHAKDDPVRKIQASRQHLPQ